ncbi:translation initiation factor 2A KNAG_0B05810 [Huiozyma naganishii CBS 8797]|uniref:Eukaryotic translation initiation factor 2A n=1 Tax=Huiozyma naganishii (strain ATCC MYA-139 / BCRC 22969 / CBS 8797 / KCTC 17520 / NBRC 10181 / NCYC 3082 / Yp74L-3) TaxID=1071383 RepID=J7RVR0_HUIN7|nr:hypothetical protein KNAG_0B05810 [Kazachstania naganishii CBS 8797]CCK69012.1 hypothetical protein KNAG_0B05810 [Kazachstania naganishii CBS 8797]
MASQFYLKTSQDIELFQGYPEFQQFSSEDGTQDAIIASLLSPCGRFVAFSTKTAVKVFSGEKLNRLLVQLPIGDVYDLKFSPAGNFLSTWQRPRINEDQFQNVKIWYLNTTFPAGETPVPVYEYIYKSQNAWTIQFSKLDNFAIRLFGKQLKIIKLDFSKLNFNFNDPFATLDQPQDNQNFTVYQVSPAEFPTICTFTPEKSGKPAQLTIWPITQGAITKKIASKTFFKADSCQLKWNQQGNAVLCLAITDFDAQNKSYYGENTLYLLSFQGVNGTLGGNSVRVSLTNGPVHDFTWSPTSRQFGVIAGYMPATVTFFDMRGNVVHSLPQQSKNTMLFSPTGRYILIGGFGNLQGAVEILDRHDKFKSVTKFEATNTSVCMWSPGGEFILTATTSPRLRVDNGIKVWHASGTLVYTKEFKELLKVDWRNPCPFKITADDHIVRDFNFSDLVDAEKIALDPKLNRTQLQVHESAVAFQAKNKRPASSAGKTAGGYKPPHARRADANGGQRTVPGVTANGKQKAAVAASTPPASAASTMSPEEKKLRSLLKKLRSIEALKQRQVDGDKLEDTQLLKIETEPKVLQDLQALGWRQE